MKITTTLFILFLSIVLRAQTPIENKTLGIHFTPSSQIENTKDLEKFISNLGKVELVYLEGNCDYMNVPKGSLIDSTCYRKSIIKNFDSITKTIIWDSSFFSTKSRLKTEDLTTLTDILFGNKYQQAEIIGGIDKAGCYSPRNGIVFYNTQNVAIGFLEICFECHGFELTSEIPFMKSTITNEELKIFKSLFTKNGIRTTEKDVFEYNRFNLEFKTSKTAEEQEALTQFLNTVYRVEFVRLMGECHHEKNQYDNSFTEECFAKSIIYEFRDSTFQPKKDLFRQTVKVKKEDFNLLYTLLYKKRELETIISNKDCYNPRNGILFYNKDNKVFAFFEICFECQGNKSTKDIPKIDRLTDKEYNELKLLFKEYGVNISKNH